MYPSYGAPMAMPSGVDPTNVIGKRIGAAVIDVLPALVISWVGSLLFSSAGSAFEGSRSGSGGTLFLFGGSLVPSLLQWGWLLGNCVIWRGMSGQSLGQMALGLRTVNAQGQPLGVPMALLRSVAGIVDYLPCCYLPIVGIATMSSTKGHQRVGDMAAKSYVIDAQYAGYPVQIPGVTTTPTGPWAVPDPGYGAPGYGAGYGSPQGYGAPGQPQGPSADPSAPQWDAARNTWIRWNAATGQWEGQEPRSGGWFPL